MIRYKVQTRYIKHGLTTHAEDKIEEAIQPFLDEGTDSGLTLHSFQATNGLLGINLVFIWQLPG